MYVLMYQTSGYVCLFSPFRACVDALFYLPSHDHNWAELEITFSEFYKMIFQGE